jgi:Iap family predicted aminopeptidase
MTATNGEPDEVWEYGPDKAFLYFEKQFDRLVTSYYAQDQEFLVFKAANDRKVVRIGQYMTITSTTPAVPAAAEIKDNLVELTQEEQERVLVIYDRLLKRRFK